MWRDAFGYTLNFTGANVVTASTGRGLAVDIDREADFALTQMRILATDLRLIAEMRDQDDRLIIQGGNQVGNLFGPGAVPYRFPGAAKIVRRTNQIRVTLTDQSAADNTVRLLFTGMQLLASAPYIIPEFGGVEPYPLALNFGSSAFDDVAQVPASGSIQGARRTPGDSWYEVHGISMSATDPRTNGGFTVQFSTNGVRDWFRSAVVGPLLGAVDLDGQGVDAIGTAHPAGTRMWLPGPYYYELNPPKLLPPNTAIVVTPTDLSTAAQTLRVTFHGVRKYQK